MRNRPLHPIARQFFDATKKDDGTFLQSIAALLHAAKRFPREEESVPAMQFLRKISDEVKEEPGVYDASPIDTAPCTVGEALQQFLDSNKLSMDEATKQLGISADQMQSLIAEMMPLTSATVPSVAQFFGTKYGLPPLTLRQWLITGLRDREMKNTEHDPARIAARKKKP
jgi:hypothetical protein